MANRDEILAALARIALPDGGTLVSRDMVRALALDAGQVRFVIEADSPDMARRIEPLRAAAEAAVRALPGVTGASVILTAHGPAARAHLHFHRGVARKNSCRTIEQDPDRWRNRP